jgi:hypothetical protein
MADWAERMFGSNPLRPNHPDFWRLSETILKYDGRVQEAVQRGEKGEDVVSACIEEVVDGESLAYMALQRAFRMLGITTAAGVQEHAEMLSRLASMYTEAFVMGSAYEQSKTRS